MTMNLRFLALALACGGENYIETVWGRGYVLRDPDEAEEFATKVA